MKKNVAGQVVIAQLASKTDGSAVTTGTTNVYMAGDGGVQTLMTSGSPEAQHLGNGVWAFYPSAGETNYDHVVFTFVNSTAVPASVQVWPSFPQTGDNYARLGAPAGASVSADIAAVKAVLPTALVGGRMDASVGAMAADTLTSSALATSAVTEIQSGLSTLDAAGVRSAVGLATNNLDTQLAALAGYVDTEVASILSAVNNIYTRVGGEQGSPSRTITEDLLSVLQALSAVKSKTDLIPASPASTGDVTTVGVAVSSIYDRIGAEQGSPSRTITEDLLATQQGLVAIRAKTDLIPASPASTSDVTTVGSTVTNVYSRIGGELGSPSRTVTEDLNSAIQALQAVLAKTDNLPADPADASDIAAAFGTVNTTLGTIAGYVDTEVAAIKAKTDLIPASPAATGDIPSASDIATAVWAYVVENSTSAVKLMRGFASALLGKGSGGGTTTMVYRDIGDTKDRITATVDADGNRSVVTTDLT